MRGMPPDLLMSDFTYQHHWQVIINTIIWTNNLVIASESLEQDEGSRDELLVNDMVEQDVVEKLEASFVNNFLNGRRRLFSR